MTTRDREAALGLRRCLLCSRPLGFSDLRFCDASCAADYAENEALDARDRRAGPDFNRTVTREAYRASEHVMELVADGHLDVSGSVLRGPIADEHCPSCGAVDYESDACRTCVEHRLVDHAEHAADMRGWSDPNGSLAPMIAEYETEASRLRGLLDAMDAAAMRPAAIPRSERETLPPVRRAS
jgi:hypothetical protein